MHAGIEAGIWVVAALLVVSIVFKIRRDKRAEAEEENKDDSAGSSGGKKESDAQQ